MCAYIADICLLNNALIGNQITNIKYQDWDTETLEIFILVKIGGEVGLK